jgi:dephospho-CoA kinase
MEKDEKLYVGLIGEMGSGKSLISNLLEKHFQAKILASSQLLRKALGIFLDDLARKDFIWFTEQLINKYGKDIISKAVFKAMRESKNKIVVFNGVRLPIDCENLKNENGILVYITASSKLRWNRVLGRKEKADDGAPYNKFMEMQKAETEKYIPELGIQADYQIINDGTLEELENKVITLFQSIIEKH